MNMQSNEQEKEQKLIQNKLKKLMIPFMLILMLVLGISFAVLNYTYQGKKKVVLTASTLNLNLDETKTLSDILVENSLPISDKEGLKQEKYSFSLLNKGPDAVDYTIYIVEDKEENQTPTSAIRYHYTRDKDNLAITRNMSETPATDGKFILETDKIASKATYQYTFQMWLGLQAGNDAMNTKYSIHLEIEASPVDKTTYASAKPFASENLGTSCKTYDDGTDTFLVGQCSKNYVWYSGKLWRVVLKNNETGAVKMVTDNNMTTIAYNEENNTAFENSYMDQWLSQEFLPTLHDTNQFLVTDSMWNVTTDSSTTPARPNGTTTVNRTVGLLNSYEYYTTYNNSDGLATYSTGYLNNGTYWWLATPFSTSYVWNANDNGALSYNVPTIVYGARPSMYLKSNIRIASSNTGDGTYEKPYDIELGS